MKSSGPAVWFLLYVLGLLAGTLTGCKSQGREQAKFEGAVTAPDGQIYTIQLQERRKTEQETEMFSGLGEMLEFAAPLMGALNPLSGLTRPRMHPPEPEADWTGEIVTSAVALGTAGYGAYATRQRKKAQDENVKLKVRHALQQPPPTQTQLDEAARMENLS